MPIRDVLRKATILVSSTEVYYPAATLPLVSSRDQPLTHQNTVSVLHALVSYKGQEGTAAALNTVLWSPRVNPGGVAPEGAIPSLGRLSNGTAPSDKPQGFRGRGGYRGSLQVYKFIHSNKPTWGIEYNIIINKVLYIYIYIS